MATAPTLPVAASPRPILVWGKRVLIAVGLLVVLLIAVFLAWLPQASTSATLKVVLERVEQGAIDDETPAFSAQVAEDLKLTPFTVVPGNYSHLSVVEGITYNAVLSLRADGRYDYALTIGTDRVHKLYQHAGLWWVEGRVLHTVLLTGDAFLTTPAARDRKTPSRERIISAGDHSLTLQAHYSPPVVFKKVE